MNPIKKILKLLFIVGLFPTMTQANQNRLKETVLCSKIATDILTVCKKNTEQSLKSKVSYLSKDLCIYLAHSSCNDCCTDMLTHLGNAGLGASTIEGATQDLQACALSCRADLPPLDF